MVLTVVIEFMEELPDIMKEARKKAENILSDTQISFSTDFTEELVKQSRDFPEKLGEFRGKLFCGKNLPVMAALLRGEERPPPLRESIDLIYIDPPFFTNNAYNSRVYSGNSDTGIKTEKQKAYDDTWSEGIPEYLKMIAPRLYLMKALLSENGSVYVHIDWHIGHYLKIIMDEIFGKDNFLNQIIWKKTNSPKSQKIGFGNQHDMILLYRKGAKFIFHPPKKVRDAKYLKSFRYDDGDGRGLYQTVPLIAAGLQKTERRRRFEFMGVTAPWLYSPEKLEDFRNQGRIFRTKAGYRLKVYLDDAGGPDFSDLWTDTDVSPVQGGSLESTGFETQKPERLMARIIETSSNKNSIVADFFSGSGTLAKVASDLGRRWIATESNLNSCYTIRKRIVQAPSFGSFSFFQANNNGKRYVLQPEMNIEGISWINIIETGDFKVKFSISLPGILNSSGITDNDQVPINFKDKENLYGTAGIDYWSVDPEYDGKIFRDSWRSFPWGSEGRSNHRIIQDHAVIELPSGTARGRFGIVINVSGGPILIVDLPFSR